MIKNPNDILQLVQLAKTFKPIISESLDDILDDYGPELGKIATRLRKYIVKETVQTINEYESMGCTREEALQLTLNTKLSLEEALKNSKKK